MRWISGIVLLICLFSVTANGQGNDRQGIDTSKYAILKYDSSIDMAMITPFGPATPTNFSKAEVESMELMVDSAYREYNKNHSNRQLIEPIGELGRQYVAVIHVKGHKQVWVNFICAQMDRAKGWFPIV